MAWSAGYDSPIPSVSATESPKRRTRTGAAAEQPGTDDVVVAGWMADGKVVLATAVVPVVAATTATMTAPTPAGTTSHARHWLTKVPMRIGRSMRWNDTTDTAKVTTTRTPKSS